MKMNRFRVNLHPAFFNLEGKSLDGGKEQTKEQLESFTKEELEELKKEILEEVSGTKKERISKRLEENGDTSQKESNDTIWTKNVTEGYGYLITTLKESHYFDGMDEKKQTDELKKVKQMYEDEVKRQYKKVVGKRSDKKFERVDQDLFDKNSPDSPANKIYTQLTGAATIATVERQYTEGYDVDILNEAESSNSVEVPQETEVDRKNRKFLSNDLPQYLRDIRKTPWVIKAIEGTGIFLSAKIDRPSEVDREAISDFLKAANRIPTRNGKSPVMVLLEALHDNELNTNSTIDTYTAVLKEHGMDLDGFKKEDGKPDYKEFRKCISRVMEVGNFYINTQKANNDVKNQHAIYLSVLGIIEDSKGAENAVNKFKSIVEEAKKTKKTEKKEGYERGEKMDETFKTFAEKLGITDFTNATRLLELSKNNPKYFQKTEVEKILANINNDNIIDARDTMVGGTKTGSQFLEVCNQVGKEKALSNLLNYAKLINQTLSLGLNNSEFTLNEIKKPNLGLILLLQDIIAKPGEDLISLLQGETGAERVNRINAQIEKEENEIKEKANAKAKEFVNGINYAELQQKGVKLPTPEEMQSGLASTLYSEYKRGVGLGGKISFDDWAKGLEFNTGFQVRDGGKTIIGIGLDYRKVANLGKGWTLAPELSAGAFIPLFDADVNGSAGLSVEVAKNWLTPKGTVQKIGVNAGVTYTMSGQEVISVGAEWSRNKSNIEKESDNKKREMQEKISEVLNLVKGAAKVDWKKLDLGNKNQVGFIKNNLENLAKELNVSEKDIPDVVNATMRLLSPYNGVDLKEGVIDAVASGVAKQFAMAWSEYRKAHISESTYLSGANLGAFWVAGTPFVGVYAGLKRTDHDLDGYGNKWGESRTIDNSKETSDGALTEEQLKSLNAKLGLSEGQGLTFVEAQNHSDGIRIPKSILHRIKVNESVKGLLARDKDNNVVVSQWTTMKESVSAGAPTKSQELFIGEGDSKFVALDTVNKEWFAQDMQDINKKILVKENKEHFYTQEGIKKGLNKLKAETKNDALKGFNPTDAEINALIGQLNDLSDKSKRAKIIIERQSDGRFPMMAENGKVEGTGLDLEYRAKLEMFDSKAKMLADKVYKWAATLNSPNEIRALHLVKHPLTEKHELYDNFVNSLLGINETKKNLEKAKEHLKSIINSVNNSLSEGKKLDISEIDNLSGSALEQALLSFNNLFARSTKVVGDGEEVDSQNEALKYNKYNFTKDMGSIIAERERQLGSTLDQRIKDPDAKEAYRKLMKATKKYREDHKSYFNIMSSRSAHLNNAVGFNLGDQNKPENPLFNPEIYENMIDLEKLDKEIFSEEDKNTLHKRAIENFINQPALFKPIKEVFGIKGDEQPEIKDIKNLKKGEVVLDIGGEKVKFKSDIKFGYFTQCVNHTVILDNIQLEDEQGNVVSYSPGSWKDGKYVEGNKTSIVSTTEVGVSASVVVHNGDKSGKSNDSTVKTEGEHEDTGELSNTTPQVDGQDNSKNGGTPAGSGTNSGNSGGRPGKKNN